MSQPPISGEDNPNNDTKPEGENSLWDGGRNVYIGSDNYNERIEGDYVEGDKVIVQPTPPLPPTGIPHNLPYSGVSQFVGRGNKLELLHQELSDCQQVVITALAGMGGIGKTELALQYALQYQDNYPGGLCWLQVRGKDLGVQIIDFARERININPPDDFDLEAQVNYCWSHWKEGTALIVLDDVPKYGNYYRENILPYLPRAQLQFKVLMTSRQRPESGIRGIDLDVLSPDAALELLKVLAGVERIEGETEAAEGLCKWLGYLPLGLELVGRYLDNHPTLELAKVQQRLENKRLAARALLQQEYGNMTAELGVAAAFELSWVELDPEAQQLSCLLGLFASVPFDWELVEQCLPDSDEEDLEEIRDGYLLKFNLLQLTSQDTYRIHPLVREFLQAKLAQLPSGILASIRKFLGAKVLTVSDCKRAFVKAMTAIAKKIPQTLTSKDIEIFKDNISHLEEVVENLTEIISDEDLIKVFTGLGKFYFVQGWYILAEPCLKKCLLVLEKRLGSNHLDVASSSNNLAVLYDSQRRYTEAEVLYQKALEIKKVVLGENNPDVASSLNNLAGLYCLQRRYKEAELLYKQALSILENLLDEDISGTASILNNLAGLYRLQRRYEEAESLYKQALSILENLLDEDILSIASILNNLAILYDSQERYSEAEPLYKQALEMREKKLGFNHPDIVSSLNNLAGLYFSQGQYSEAEPLYKQALEMRKKMLGLNYPDLADSLKNLAEIYLLQGRYSEGEELYKQALSMLEKTREANPQE